MYFFENTIHQIWQICVALTCALVEFASKLAWGHVMCAALAPPRVRSHLYTRRILKHLHGAGAGARGRRRRRATPVPAPSPASEALYVSSARKFEAVTGL